MQACFVNVRVQENVHSRLCAPDAVPVVVRTRGAHPGVEQDLALFVVHRRPVEVGHVPFAAVVSDVLLQSLVQLGNLVRRGARRKRDADAEERGGGPRVVQNGHLSQQVVRHRDRLAERRHERRHHRPDGLNGQRWAWEVDFADLLDQNTVADIVGRRKKDVRHSRDDLGAAAPKSKRDAEEDRGRADDRVPRSSPEEQSEKKRDEGPDGLCDSFYYGVDVGKRGHRGRQELPLGEDAVQRRLKVVFANLRQRRGEELAEDLELERADVAIVALLHVRTTRAKHKQQDSPPLAVRPFQERRRRRAKRGRFLRAKRGRFRAPSAHLARRGRRPFQPPRRCADQAEYTLRHAAALVAGTDVAKVRPEREGHSERLGRVLEGLKSQRRGHDLALEEVRQRRRCLGRGAMQRLRLQEDRQNSGGRRRRGGRVRGQRRLGRARRGPRCGKRLGRVHVRRGQRWRGQRCCGIGARRLERRRRGPALKQRPPAHEAGDGGRGCLVFLCPGLLASALRPLCWLGEAGGCDSVQFGERTGDLVGRGGAVHRGRAVRRSLLLHCVFFQNLLGRFPRRHGDDGADQSAGGVGASNALRELGRRPAAQDARRDEFLEGVAKRSHHRIHQRQPQPPFQRPRQP
mmetsp:Transcript_7278/g.25515  ORF Transcript_7278/g.25515 Transcript_7278/m.25515 type:complete len:630 (-) Transcript_7278:203-2092(-)